MKRPKAEMLVLLGLTVAAAAAAVVVVGFKGGS